nr:MAG TPA: hypothetical protein [Caudoviricetes sp.]
MEETRGEIITFIISLTPYALRMILDIITLGITISIEDLGSLTTLVLRLS